MTTTWSTDQQVTLRCPLIATALAAVAASMAGASSSVVTLTDTTPTLDDFRVEAKRQLLIDLRHLRGLTEDALTRTADLQEPEIALACALVFEAATQQRSQQRREMYDDNAIWWRRRYSELLAACSPVDSVKSEGRSFTWGRA